MAVTPDVLATYVDRDGEAQCLSLGEVDARAVVEGQPVRLPPSYMGQRHHPGYFWSATMGRHLVYESLLELSWLWLADFDAAVVGIAAQPMLWEGADDGARRIRYPDFLCVRRDRSAHVVDVKAPQALKEPKVAASLNWTRGVCEARGWTYEVWTGVDPVVVRNIRFIAAGRRPDLADPDVLRVVVECAGRSEVLTELEQLVSLEALPVPPRLAVLAAFWHGLVRCDLTVPLSGVTRVELAA